MSMRWSLLIFAVVFSAATLLAGCGGGGGGTGGSITGTGTLTGTVYVPDGTLGDARADAPDGFAPLANAAVHVVSHGKTFDTTTDLSGCFSIADVPTGEANITVTPPAGSLYKAFTGTATVAKDSTTSVGQGGISLINKSSGNLSVALDSIDASNWPDIELHVSVQDPQSNAPVLGLASKNFTLRINGTSVQQIILTSQDQQYILKVRIPDPAAGTCAAEVTAKYSQLTGQISGSASRTNGFLSPLGAMNVTSAFKDPNFATKYPGKWHQGTDISASLDAPVYAIAKGEVVSKLISGQSTSIVVLHKLTVAVAGTQNVYVTYTNVTPIVGANDIVNAGQQIGRIARNTAGNHLHFGIRVGQNITSGLGLGNLINGQIPAADVNGLTDGWVDPIAFLAANSPDNNWN